MDVYFGFVVAPEYHVRVSTISWNTYDIKNDVFFMNKWKLNDYAENILSQ